MPININQQYIAPSVAMTTPANPTAPASTTATYKMQGLGALITPQLSLGCVLANISGTVNWVSSGAVGVGIALQMYYGPMVSGVAAPANAAALPGGAVAIGNPTMISNGVVLTTIGDNLCPVDLTGLAKGLTAGQQYWFDLGAYSLTTASDSFITSITVTLVEIG
jgi:hypothetical protein